MQFLTETRDALDEYLCLTGPDLDDSLLMLGESAARIVPDCVGLSLTLADEDLTFTLVETDRLHDAAGDAGVTTEEPSDEDAPLDEESWAQAAREEAAAGVASSLCLSMVHHGRVVGDLHLYASSPDAFRGRHQDLAVALGASASGAVTNADLGFESRRRAEEAPRKLREQHVIEVGVGILAAREDLDLEAARERLHAAAGRAGLSDVQAAQLLVDMHRG